MNEGQIYLIGVIIAFCYCFFRLYKTKDEIGEDMPFALIVIFIVSLFSWVAIVYFLCLAFLSTKGSK